MEDPRSERIRVFRDTMQWCGSDPSLRAAIKASKAGTAVYKSGDYPPYDRRKRHDTAITLSGKRTFEAAVSLLEEEPKVKVAVLSFANAFTPGGGVATGASAQEECLCRCSTLYPLLDRYDALDDFYGFHARHCDNRASDAVIYTPGVVICKTDSLVPERLPEDEWRRVDVLTCAAPDMRGFGAGAFMSPAELYAVHVKRAEHILSVAAANKNDALVLGAFGCGAFRNDPETVARAWRTVLAEFDGIFKRVEFAIYQAEGTVSANLEAFKKIFSAGE
ncbi:MAG: TIGR02452 family protein [Oscillospiraceae bacterium]|nr:TIGR02452 family protein [Oscillospiraceae bacterium]